MPVQDYEEKISPDATQAAPPEELHPVAAAFGGNIGEALQQGGQQIASRIESLSLHLARMNYYRGEAQRADLLNQYKTAFQNKLYGDPKNPDATVTKIGDTVIPNDVELSAGDTPSNTSPAAQAVEVPAAVYSRQGYAASGAIQDVDDWHQRTSAQIIQQAQGLGMRNLGVLKSQMDSAWSAERMSVVKHEATQVDAAQQKTFLHGMQLDADNAITKQDPFSLGRTIDSINDQNKVLNDSQHKDEDDPIRELTANKFVGQALNNSMTANLRSNAGDPTQFQGILDKLHDDGKINDTVYDNAQEHLDKLARGMKSQDEMAAKTQQVNQRMNTMQLALQHKIDLNNPNTASEISAQDPELGTALSNYNLNKNDNYKDEDEAFAKATENIFSAGSKEQISQYMTKVLKESKISQDRLNILFGAAMDRGQHLADLEGQSKAKNPIQNMIDGGIKALLNWGKENGHDANAYTDFLGAVKSKPVPDAYNEAIRNAVIRKTPEVATMPTTPNYVVGKTNDIKFVFARTNRKENGSSDTGKPDKSGE